MATLTRRVDWVAAWYRWTKRHGLRCDTPRFFDTLAFRERLAEREAIRARHGKPAKRRR